ncbi:MAG: thiamine phosphate synthase, partial [Gemmatimonadales bacterium]
MIKLIAIADTAVIGARDWVQVCLAAEAGGATALQLRMKGVPAGRVFETAVSLVAALTIPVIVNDRCDVAVLAGAGGVHLGRDDLPVGSARCIPGGEKLIIGTSVGNLAEARAALNDNADYWGIGAVYGTPNKADAGAPIGVSGFARLVGVAGAIPTVAIGGVDATNCVPLMRAGARGVAAIGAVFGTEEVERATRTDQAAEDARAR